PMATTKIWATGRPLSLPRTSALAKQALSANYSRLRDGSSAMIPLLLTERFRRTTTSWVVSQDRSASPPTIPATKSNQSNRSRFNGKEEQLRRPGRRHGHCARSEERRSWWRTFQRQEQRTERLRLQGTLSCP